MRVLIIRLAVVLGTVAAIVLASASLALAGTNRPQFTDPPECHAFTIPSGAVVYQALACGEGPDQEPPLHGWVTQFIDDGGGLVLQCGLAGLPSPCVFIAPGGPPS